MNALLQATFGLLVMAASGARAAPCAERVPALTFTGLTAFYDCQESDVLYAVPGDLTITDATFSGTKSFKWRERSDGSAIVEMSFALVVDDGLLMRALSELKRARPRRYKLRPLDVRNVRFEGFGGEGILSQQLLAFGQLSDSRFTLRVALDPRGVELWKRSAAEDFWDLEAGLLRYEFALETDGVPTWREQAHFLRIESLPDCAILGGACDEDVHERLAQRGRAYGRRHFEMQFAECRNFADGTVFEAPRRVEVAEPGLEEHELETALLYAREGFNAERDSRRAECGEALEGLAGEAWWQGFKADRGIGCGSIMQWPWPRVREFLAGRSETFVRGAQRSYDEFRNVTCGQAAAGWTCDERVGGSCPADLVEPDLLCVSSGALASRLAFRTGHCSIAGYTRGAASGSYILHSRTSLPTTDAIAVDTCLRLSEAFAGRGALAVKITCNSED
jgi:hypothetical protein